jgi:hypothetical protein
MDNGEQVDLGAKTITVSSDQVGELDKLAACTLAEEGAEHIQVKVIYRQDCVLRCGSRSRRRLL